MSDDSGATGVQSISIETLYHQVCEQNAKLQKELESAKDDIAALIVKCLRYREAQENVSHKMGAKNFKLEQRNEQLCDLLNDLKIQAIVNGQEGHDMVVEQIRKATRQNLNKS